MAGVGVIGNGLSAWLLHRDAAHSLNVRGAFLHMVGDLLTSVAVLANGKVWIPGATVLGNLLLLAFFTALLFNLYRGLDVSCGCFSTTPGDKGAGYLTVFRDLLFLIVSGYLFRDEFLRTAPVPATQKASRRKRTKL